MKIPLIKLNDQERIVLKVLTIFQKEAEFPYLKFAVISHHTKLDRRTVRIVCRSLKRKGLAEFAHGLWTDEGMPYGSGYAATALGASFLNSPPIQAPHLCD